MEYHPWASFLGSGLASLLLFWPMAHRYLPAQLQSFVSRAIARLFSIFNPYIDVKIHEYTSERLHRSPAYSATQAYLMATTAKRARRLKADREGKGAGAYVVVSMDDNEQVTDDFKRAKLWWTACSRHVSSQGFSFYPREDVRRYYKLSFLSRHRDMVVEEYLPHVFKEGERIKVERRQRKLFMNSSRDNGRGGGGSTWSHVVFEHPATFGTLAMEPDKKQELVQDLIAFSKAEDYYRKIGKAWKRGYLLYGPPGTGKSTLIAAMANFLDYDIYDLELTAVKDNTELRKLLVDTTTKSILVIEDIDCSLDLTGKRAAEEKKPNKEKEDGEGEKEKMKGKSTGEDGASKVTLSGVLNFIDGLWSACEGERIIVFTTNYVEKLDPALTRRGRMDKHIEMSYCSFEAFKVLAWNYLDLDSHPLFDEIRHLLQDCKVTPADVAEILMLKSLIPAPEENARACLEMLIQELQKAREEALRKASLDSSCSQEQPAAVNDG